MILKITKVRKQSNLIPRKLIDNIVKTKNNKQIKSHCELLHWANTHATTRGMVALGAVTLGDPLSLLGECDANALFFLFFCPFLFYLLLEDCAFVTQIAQSIQVNTLHQWFFPFHSRFNELFILYMHQLFILVSIPKDSIFCSLYKQFFFICFSHYC